MNHFLRYAFGGFVVLLILLFGGFYGWSRHAEAVPAPEAIAALASSERVEVEDGSFLVFRPKGAQPATGFILYPGAACDIRGYAPLLRRIAERGYLVVGVRMPFNMSILATGRADDVRAAFPEIGHWVIAGHSLGGAMAALHAHRHPEGIDGLVLWDSWPPESDPLVDADFPVWVIHRAREDGSPPEKLEATRHLFPVDSTWVPVPGGNHMQFGSFIGGTYQEEWPATISAAAEHDIIVTGTLNALLAMAPPPN